MSYAEGDNPSLGNHFMSARPLCVLSSRLPSEADHPESGRSCRPSLMAAFDPLRTLAPSRAVRLPRLVHSLSLGP